MRPSASPCASGGTLPLADGGTAVVLHAFGRAFGHGPGAPYRDLFHVLRDGHEPDRLATQKPPPRKTGARLPRTEADVRPTHCCRTADWQACRPALERLGRVIVAGCRDAGAARALGFVPSHSVATALEMAHGVAEGRARVGFLLAPPYAPLLPALS